MSEDKKGANDNSNLFSLDEKIVNGFFENIPAGLGVFKVAPNFETSFLYLNDGYYNMIGVERKDRAKYYGNKVLDAVYEKDQPKVKKEIVDSLVENRMADVQFRLLFGDGTYHWIGIRATHKKQSDGSHLYYAAYYNIDSLMQVQDKLTESETILREMIANSETQYFTYYPKKHRYEMTVVNSRYEKLPMSMDNFPESFIQYTHLSERDAESYRHMVAAIDRGEPRAEGDFCFKYEDGYIWLRVHFTSVYDTQGKVEKALGYSFDITQLRNAEKQLTDKALQMKALGSTVLAASCFNVTKDYNIELNNNNSIRYTDYSLQTEHNAEKINPEIANQRKETKKVLLNAAEQIPDEEQRKQFLKACSHTGMLKAFDAGKRETILEYKRNTNKGLIWVSTRIELMKEPDTGDVIAFYYTTDINDRKLGEEIAQRVISEEYENFLAVDLKTRTLFLPKSISTSQKTIKDNQDYDATFNHFVETFVDEKDKEECRKNYNLDNILEQLKTKTRFTFTYSINQKAAKLKSDIASVDRIDVFYLNKEKDVLIFVRSDVSSIFAKEKEEKKKLAELALKAESANTAKSDFLSRMSHDIRTPLNGILGMTTLARDEALSPKVVEYLNKIDSSGHFLLGLVNDILDMSKVESGKMELHPEVYPYVDFKQYLEAVICPLCEEKNISFDMPEENKKYSLVVDKLRFNQIIFNLLSNAVKFTQNGGTISMEKRNVVVTNGKATFDIVVQDNGKGMSEEFQKKLFQPFEQEYTDKNASRTGSGLGLAITKSLVELMGGTISVKSKLGEGSTFTVHLSLPIVPITKVANQPKEETLKSLEGKHILLAEDNEINAEIAKALLEKKGIVVTVASTGVQAIELFTKNLKIDSVTGKEVTVYDIILMDIRMPEMDGLEATKKIRAMNFEYAKKIPIIAMTANAFDDDVKESLAAGMNAHLSKPIEPEIMYETIQRFV